MVEDVGHSSCAERGESRTKAGSSQSALYWYHEKNPIDMQNNVRKSQLDAICCDLWWNLDVIAASLTVLGGGGGVDGVAELQDRTRNDENLLSPDRPPR